MAGKPKAPERVKTYTLRVRMTEAERELLERAAQLRSLETSTWARSELVELARRMTGGPDGVVTKETEGTGANPPKGKRVPKV